jgi:hypothetical protein
MLKRQMIGLFVTFVTTIATISTAALVPASDATPVLKKPLVC